MTIFCTLQTCPQNKPTLTYILRAVQNHHYAKPVGPVKGKGRSWLDVATKPAKRLKTDKTANKNATDAEDDKPTENEITAAGSEGQAGYYNSKDDDTDLTEDAPQADIPLLPPGASRAGPHAVTIPLLPEGAQLPNLGSNPLSTPAPIEPPIEHNTRLGYWRCRLCTSQKYLNTPPPKQPSEPGTWPLRDVSKIVTHFTRMHAEHNNVERCMELGAALRANRGPMRHWLVRTKKERVEMKDIDKAVDDLENGQMPSILRRVSKAAADFPDN